MRFLSRSSIGMTISCVIEGRKKGRRSRPFFLPQYSATLVIPNEVRNLRPTPPCKRGVAKELFYFFYIMQHPVVQPA